VIHSFTVFWDVLDLLIALDTVLSQSGRLRIVDNESIDFQLPDAELAYVAATDHQLSNGDCPNRQRTDSQCAHG